MLSTAKIFVNGRSQAIRLPKEYRFDGDEVYINKIDDVVIIMPKKNPWVNLLKSLNKFTDDFLRDRNQLQNQKRDIS
ncbi:MAG: type II toxin-antitoxin system VapB family antitoxin [bacterium]